MKILVDAILLCAKKVYCKHQDMMWLLVLAAILGSIPVRVQAQAQPQTPGSALMSIINLLIDDDDSADGEPGSGAGPGEPGGGNGGNGTSPGSGNPGTGDGSSNASPLPVMVPPAHLRNADAGTLPGSLSVGTDGQANYGINIIVPPGTAGMQPALSLSYSSNGSNGMVGLGWSLGGLSSIHRCAKTVANDGIAGRISFDTADRLCLDGQRLLRADGTNAGTDVAAQDAAYWAEGALFRTEIEAFSRITRLSNGFKVEDKDGRIRYFGTDENSAIAAQGRSDGRPLLWPVSRIEDRSGNYITVSYSTDATTGEYVPNQIRYGGNSIAGTQADLAVRFVYKSRSDAQTQYMGGSRNDLRSLLSHVETYIDTSTDGTGGTLTRSYEISYINSANSGRSLVSWIQLSGRNPVSGAMESLPRTDFSWGAGGGPKLLQKQSFDLSVMGDGDEVPMHPSYTGAVHGGGITSVMVPWLKCTNKNCFTRIYEGSMHGQSAAGSWFAKFDMSKLAAGAAYNNMLTGDLNGDGIDDLVLLSSNSNRWAYCMAQEPTGGNPVFSQCQDGGAIALASAEGAKRASPLLVDVDGNGKSQLLYFDKSNQATACSVNGGVSCRVIPTTVPAGVVMIGLQPISLSRQGKSDFFMVPNNAWGESKPLVNVILCRTTQAGMQCSVLDSGPNVASGLGAGDINNDGLTDFFFNGSDGASKLCLSTELGVDCRSMQVHGAVGSPNDNTGFGYYFSGITNMLGDGVSRYWAYSAGAGRPDRICRLADGVEVCQSVDVSGLPVATQQLIETSPSTSRPFNIDSSGIQASLNCEQLARVVAPGAYWQRCWVTSLVMPPEQDRLTAVKNGVGYVSQVDYARGADGDVYSRFGSVASAIRRPIYPQVETDPGVVVKQLRQSNGQGGWIAFNHRYAGAMADATGRGSLGFTTVSVVDVGTGITVESVNSQVFPLTGMPIATRKFTASCVLENSSYTLAQANLAMVSGAVNYFNYVSASTTVRKDLDCSDLGTSSTVSEYTDGWGNLNVQTIRTEGGDRSFSQIMTAAYFTDLGSNYLAGLPTSLSTTRTEGANSIRRVVAHTYNSTTGLPETETVEPGNPALMVKTTFDRNGNLFGLINTVTQSWSDPACGAVGWPEAGCIAAKSRVVSSTDFDAKGRFPVTIKNALGHTSSQTFDPATGAMISRTDANNLQTFWTIDGFGRVKVELRPDGNETRQYLKNCQSDCPPNATSVQIVDQFHGADRIAAGQLAYRDSVGHVQRSTTLGFDGKQIIVDQTFDSRGRPYESYQPRFENQPAILASRQLYDDLNRSVSIISLDDTGTERSLTTQYRGLTIEQTNAKLQVRTETRDVLGQLRAVLDSNSPRGKTSFTYEPFGGLQTTTDPNNNVTTVEYDILGRRTDLRDPDLGWISYDIDPLGQNYAQTSPEQRASKHKSWMAYDLLGRMTSRYETSATYDLESHWIFDTAANGVGQLAEAFTSKPARKDYRRVHSYDEKGRPKSTTQYLFDGKYTSLQSYDAWGRASAQTYQRGTDTAKTFALRYNDYGYLERVERGAMVLWRAIQQDASNRVEKVTLGNGLVQQRSYNPYSGRMDHGELMAANVARLQESYSYDVLGNVTTRGQYWDAGGFQESFGYDDLNRLKSSHVLGGAEQIFTYDAVGNILTKTGLGTYTYPAGVNAPQAHAVQSISGLPGAFSYDKNGNLLAGAGRTASWTSFDMPLTIKKNGAAAAFYYGPEHQRLRQLRGDGNIVYAGAQEVEHLAGSIRVKTYWPNGLGVEIDAGDSTKLHWTHVDRLGSVVAYTGADGELKADGKLEYDPWGKRRSTVDHSDVGDGINGKIDNRGFTGHEMLDQLDLVHMNGRVYDPLIGKFMSADMFIQFPDNGQSYNRYSYVLNNPTNHTDPTGFLSHIFGGGCSWENFCGILHSSDVKDQPKKDESGGQAAAATRNRTEKVAGKSSVQVGDDISANSKTYFIGGAADKYKEFGQGPTNIMGDVQAEYAKTAPPGADSAYYGYQDRKEIVADITTIKANDPASDINIVGHSRGAALGINIAANELAKANIQINILIAIDPVGTRFTTPGLWMPSALSNVTTFINLNASAKNPDATDRIAWAGGHYGEGSRKFTPLYFNLNYNHGQAAAMLKAPITLPNTPAQSAWDYLLQNTQNTGK